MSQKVKFVQRKPKPQVLHEFNHKGQHRLVLVDEEGNKTSQWYENHQIGQFNGLLFAGYVSDSPLLGGVFRQTMIESRNLPPYAIRNEKAMVEAAAGEDKANRIETPFGRRR
jgi:hypothetical protein